MGGALDDGAAVVERVDALGDVRHQQPGDLLDREHLRPVALRVIALVVDPRGRHQVDAGSSAHLGEQQHVAPRVGGHGIDHGAKAEGLGWGQLGDRLVDVVQAEVGEQLHRPAPGDDEMLVSVGHAEVGSIDVAEDGAHEGHGGPPGAPAIKGLAGGPSDSWP